MKFRYAVLVLALGAIECTFGQAGYVPVHTFDQARDAAADVDRAIAEAGKTGKRILLDIGGDWCPWHHLLDEVFNQTPGLRQLREDNFITVAIYYGPENKNERILSRYSKLLGLPHYFVLEKDGSLLHSQHVIELQTNGTYSAEKLKEFLIKWSRTK
jgi:thiol:disulfide interchange protein